MADDGDLNIDLRSSTTAVPRGLGSVDVATPDEGDLRQGAPDTSLLMDESHHALPNPVTGNVATVRNAFGEAYGSTGAPSITREGIRSFFTPETQQQMAGHWWGPAANFAGDVAGTGIADVAGGLNSVSTLANEALRSVGVPEPAIRDLNLEVTRRAGDVPQPLLLKRAPILPRDVPAVNEFTEPLVPAKPLNDLFERERQARVADLRATAPGDPVTDATIQLLRKGQGVPSIPNPPEPFAPGYRAYVDPTKPFTYNPPTSGWPAGTGTWAANRAPGGLLNMQPPTPLPTGGLLQPGGAPPAAPLTAAEILERAVKPAYKPADDAAAKGAFLPQEHADAMRKTLTDAVPTNPEELAYFGNPKLVEVANTAKANVGNPMDFSTAMRLDENLTQRIRESQDANEKRLLGNAQQAIRDQMDQVPELAGQGDARAAYQAYKKQSAVEDLEYRASLLPPERRDAYIRSQAVAQLGNQKKMAGWNDDERAQWEALAQSGDLGPIKRTVTTLMKPAARAVGAGLGGWVAGTPGAIVGGEVGSDMGTAAAAALRRRWGAIDLTPLKQQISAGVPDIQIPPPPRPTTSSGGGWRPVQQGEIFPPGQRFRMNQATGKSEVWAP
jgi:hypothetical protein